MGTEAQWSSWALTCPPVRCHDLCPWHNFECLLLVSLWLLRTTLYCLQPIKECEKSNVGVSFSTPISIEGGSLDYAFRRGYTEVTLGKKQKHRLQRNIKHLEHRQWPIELFERSFIFCYFCNWRPVALKFYLWRHLSHAARSLQGFFEACRNWTQTWHALRAEDTAGEFPSSSCRDKRKQGERDGM